MRLDFDIAKDVLLFLEEYLVLDSSSVDAMHDIDFAESQICKHFNDKYLEEDVRYAIIKLAEADYIDAKDVGWIKVTAITYRGHEFLDTIRDQTIYKKGKDAMVKTGVNSLEMLMTICSEIAKSFLLAQIGLG